MTGNENPELKHYWLKQPIWVMFAVQLPIPDSIFVGTLDEWKKSVKMRVLERKENDTSGIAAWNALAAITNENISESLNFCNG